MSQPDAEIVKELYRAFPAQDGPALQQLFDPAVVRHQPGGSVLAGDHRGVAAVMSFFGRVGELSEDTFTVELHDVASATTTPLLCTPGTDRLGGRCSKSTTPSSVTSGTVA